MGEPAKLFLEVQGITKAFGGLLAVKNVDFSLREDEILGLIGPNGAGKTTVYNLISGLLPPDAGKIFLHRVEITGLPAHVITTKGIARTFQGTRIFSNLTLLENFLIARDCHPRHNSISFSTFFSFLHPFPKSSLEDDLIRRTIQLLGLSYVQNRLAGELVLIDQILLGIGMALCTQPTILLLDEPSAGLNSVEVERIMSIIRKIREKGIPILLIEHNMKALMSVCDRVVVLNHGQKIAEGSPYEISNNQDVIKAYLGTRHAARS